MGLILSGGTGALAGTYRKLDGLYSGLNQFQRQDTAPHLYLRAYSTGDAYAWEISPTDYPGGTGATGLTDQVAVSDATMVNPPLSPVGGPGTTNVYEIDGYTVISLVDDGDYASYAPITDGGGGGGSGTFDHLVFTKATDTTPITEDTVLLGDTVTYHAKAYDADNNELGSLDLVVTGTQTGLIGVAVFKL